MCRLEYCGQKNKKYSFEYFLFIRARDGTRTRGPDLGKVVLHQLSHSRITDVTKCQTHLLLYCNKEKKSIIILKKYSKNCLLKSFTSWLLLTLFWNQPYIQISGGIDPIHRTGIGVLPEGKVIRCLRKGFKVRISDRIICQLG